MTQSISSKFIVIILTGLLIFTNSVRASVEMSIPNDPAFADEIRGWWATPTGMNAFAMWDIQHRHRELIVIGLIDSGTLPTHEEIAGHTLPGINFSHQVTITDTYGHGTHMSGLLVATHNNGLGLAGVCQSCLIKPYKVYPYNNNADDFVAQLIAAIHQAIDDGVLIINMSISLDIHYVGLESAVKYAASKGVLIVAPSGNDNGRVYYPAAYADTLAVGAINRGRIRWAYSNTGPELDVVAPGSEIYTTEYTSDRSYISVDGTSLSVAFVTGLIAQIMSTTRTLTPQEIRAIIEGTADDLGTRGFDDEYGFGAVNAERAMREAIRRDTRVYVPLMRH